jgi:hypothetical protein
MYTLSNVINGYNAGFATIALDHHSRYPVESAGRINPSPSKGVKPLHVRKVLEAAPIGKPEQSGLLGKGKYTAHLGNRVSYQSTESQSVALLSEQRLGCYVP